MDRTGGNEAMKLICKVDKEIKSGFTEFVAVVEITDGKLVEIVIGARGYSDSLRIEIEYAGVSMSPGDLQISCYKAHAAQVLLALEVCNFVRQQFPELAKLKFKDKRFVVEETA
jgi:hypothetical protein